MVGELEEAASSKRALAITSDGILVRLTADKAASVCGNESRRLRRIYAGFSAMPKPMDSVHPAKASRQRTRDSLELREEAARPVGPCHGCRDEKKYRPNMSDRGEQKPFQEPLSICDLLRFIGRLNPRWSGLIARASELTVACYDIETLSIGNELRAGEEDPAFPFVPLLEGSGADRRRAADASGAANAAFAANAAATAGGSGANDLPCGDGVGKASRRLLSLHRPLLIGFTDERIMSSFSSDSDEAGVSVLGGWSAEDETKPTYELVGEFMTLVRLSRSEAAREKRTLLAPILDWIEQFKSVHDAFFDAYDFSCFYGEFEMERELVRRLMRLPVAALVDGSADLLSGDGPLSPDKLRRCVEEGMVERAKQGWDATLLGVLHNRVLKLAESYHVYAHNASGFDAVLLAPYLIAEYKSRSTGCKVSILREGNKIRQLKVDNIYFLDSKYLAPPGSSLEQWSKLAQVMTSKSMFPFRLLTSHAFLRQRRLPRDAEQWESDLHPGRKVSQERVDELVEEYESAGCESVGSFLAMYLKRDVLCLMQCLKKMMLTYHQTMDLHLPDVGKFSISGLSSCSAQHYLARNKRIAFTFPNHTLIYSVSRCPPPPADRDDL